MTPHPPTTILALAALAAVSVAALGAGAAWGAGGAGGAGGAPPGAQSPGAAAAGGERFTLPLAGGEREVVVVSPDAFASEARVLEPDGAGGMREAPGYRVRARVTLRPADPVALDKALEARGRNERAVAIAAQGRLAEFRMIDVASVRGAAELAAALRGEPGCADVTIDAFRPRTLRDVPTDPGYPQQWHLSNAAVPAASINVVGAWNAGLTGSGVTVAVIEEGFNAEHPDLAANFNETASQTPPWPPGFIDHGTCTAGLVGAAANNGKGGAGVAFGARVSRGYIGYDTDNQAAFAYRNDLNFVKSNSWGPLDNANIAFMSAIESAAIEDAATLGRGGKGSVFVWAGGNGGQAGDRTSYDPYASSRYAIAVGSIDNIDRRAIYSEPGSSLLVVATSSYDFFGSNGSGIYTSTGSATSGDGDYTAFFGGTSAAAPIASGVVALVLQANPNLTWRDVQHVLMRTARKCNPTDPSWVLNGAGRWTSDEFGFGAIDAAAAAALAPVFVLRAPETTVTIPVVTLNAPIPDDDGAGVVSAAATPAHLIVEHAEVILNAPHGRIGDLRVELISPSGTVSLLADARSDYTSGYANYAFTSVRSWGERAGGTWTLRVSDRLAGATGTLVSWQLKLHGARPRCPADWDNSTDSSGSASIDDLFLFLGDYFAGQADFDNSGACSIDDLFLYLNAYFVPCP